MVNFENLSDASENADSSLLKSSDDSTVGAESEIF